MDGWRHGAAEGLLRGLKQESTKHGKRLGSHTLELLLDRQRARLVVARAASKGGMTRPDEQLAHAQMEHHGSKAAEAMEKGGMNAAMQAVHSFLKPMRQRGQARAELGVLEAR
jgi:hypothetical protein